MALWAAACAPVNQDLAWMGQATESLLCPQSGIPGHDTVFVVASQAGGQRLVVSFASWLSGFGVHDDRTEWDDYAADLIGQSSDSVIGDGAEAVAEFWGREGSASDACDAGEPWDGASTLNETVDVLEGDITLWAEDGGVPMFHVTLRDLTTPSSILPEWTANDIPVWVPSYCDGEPCTIEL